MGSNQQHHNHNNGNQKTFKVPTPKEGVFGVEAHNDIVSTIHAIIEVFEPHSDTVPAREAIKSLLSAVERTNQLLRVGISDKLNKLDDKKDTDE